MHGCERADRCVGDPECPFVTQSMACVEEMGRQVRGLPYGGEYPAHPTCIDVTGVSQKPGSSWICGPQCPTP